MNNIAKVAKDDFSIIVYENWKNLRIIWGEMEKYWQVRNMLVWHLPNRHQGFAARHKFFSKHAAILGNTGSGKSCTLTSILHSLFEYEYNGKKLNNAHFIIFDTNGEYKQAFFGNIDRNIEPFKEKELNWLLSGIWLISLSAGNHGSAWSSATIILT